MEDHKNFNFEDSHDSVSRLKELNAYNSEDVFTPVSFLPTRSYKTIGLLKAIKNLVVFGAPLSVMYFGSYMLTFYSIFVAGRMGVLELGGTVMASSLISCTSVSLSLGFCGALETFLSQTYGKDPTSKYFGVHVQRTVMIMLICAFIVGVIFSYIDTFLNYLGQNSGVTYYTAFFTRIALIGVIPAMLIEVVKRYYQAIHWSTPLGIIAAIVVVIIHPAALLTFWLGLKLGYFAIPFAWSIAQIGYFSMLLGVLIVSKRYQSTWGGFSPLVFTRWGPTLKLGFAGLLMIMSEWVAIEMNIIAAGFTTPVQLAAFSTTIQLSYVFWNITGGIFSSVTIHIGTCVGQGEPLVARKYAISSVILALCIGTTNAIIIIFTGNYVVRVFTDEPQVLALVSGIVPFCAIFHFFDVLQGTILAIFRGCGMHIRGALCGLFSYTLIGCPIGWFMCFYMHWGVRTLAIGPACGMLMCGIPIAILSLVFMKWEDLKLADNFNVQPELILPTNIELDADSSAPLKSSTQEFDQRSQ